MSSLHLLDNKTVDDTSLTAFYTRSYVQWMSSYNAKLSILNASSSLATVQNGGIFPRCTSKLSERQPDIHGGDLGPKPVCQRHLLAPSSNMPPGPRIDSVRSAR